MPIALRALFIFSLLTTFAADAAHANKQSAEERTRGFAASQRDSAETQADKGSGRIAVRYDTPSTFPVPRFVSLKSDEVNCRIGPSQQHPTRFVFKRSGAPVLIIAESVDNWRKVLDADGDTCWLFAKTVRAQTHILSLEATDIHARPSSDSEVRAHLESRALVKLVRITDGWALVEADGVRGWGPAERFWGADAVAAASGAMLD